MTEQTNTPELRFPGFRDEWKVTKLGNILEDTNVKENYNVPLYSLTVENGITEKTERYNREFLVKKNNNFKIVKPFNIVYNPMNITLGAIDLLSMDKEIKVSGYYNVLRIINQTNPFFLINLLKTYKSILLFKKVATGSLREKQRVHFSEFKNLKKYLPSYIEQEKIGSFFSKLDRQIELEEKKLELLEQQKKGYMQKLFSQELRFKDKNGDEYPNWNTSQLGEITKTFSGGTPKSNNSSYYNGDIPFIRSGEISKRITELKITETALNNSSAKLVEKGDLLYALYGATSGEVAISKINGAINQAVLCIKSEESINFLLNFLRLQKQHILKTYIQGGQGNLSASIVKGITIKLPCREEQKKIGKFLDKVGILIEKQSTKIDLLKQRKQGLLQKMFV